MELTSKKGFALSRFTVFGVAQFFLYMSIFAAYYLHHQAEMSNPSWRVCGLVAVVAALLVSWVPYMLHNIDSVIYPFVNVIVPVALYLLCVAGYCFYNWTVPPADEFLITFSGFYLFGTVGFSVLSIVLEGAIL